VIYIPQSNFVLCLASSRNIWTWIPPQASVVPHRDQRTARASTLWPGRRGTIPPLNTSHQSVNSVFSLRSSEEGLTSVFISDLISQLRFRDCGSDPAAAAQRQQPSPAAVTRQRPRGSSGISLATATCDSQHQQFRRS
jgi:hypothetical protein